MQLYEKVICIQSATPQTTVCAFRKSLVVTYLITLAIASQCALVTSSLPNLNNTITQCQSDTRYVKAMPSNSVKTYTVIQKSTPCFTHNV